MARTHHYDVTVEWTGNLGTGTDSYRSFGRDHEVRAPGKPTLPGSADPAFRGDPRRWNPEELLITSVAQCHMLWYLHLCSARGVTVVDYRDSVAGVMTMDPRGGGGQMTEVLLRPSVTITADSSADVAAALHEEVPGLCFIARSVNFPIRHEATIRTAT